MRIKTVFILLLASTLSFNFSFTQKEALDDIKNAIKSGSAKDIAAYFNSTVDVTIDDDIQSYSKTQAEYVFKDFFKSNPPSSFTIVHQGSSKGGLPYAIGQFISGEKTYRVWMRIKKAQETFLIHEISFIKE